MCPMSNHPSYAGDLVNPREEVETVLVSLHYIQLFLPPPPKAPPILLSDFLASLKTTLKQRTPP